MPLPSYIPTQEARLVGAVIGKALRKGYRIAVCDEECVAVKATKDRAAIEAEVGVTELTHLVIFKDRERLGFVGYLLGEGEDCIYDHTDTPAIRELVAY